MNIIQHSAAISLHVLHRSVRPATPISGSNLSRSFTFHRAMSTTPPQDLVSFLHTSFPSAVPEAPNHSNLSLLSYDIYPSVSLTDNEKVEIAQWLITASHITDQAEDDAKHTERLGSLNIHLSTRTTLLGSKPSIADLALYYRMAPVVRKWSAEERSGEKGYHHIVRHVDCVQNSPLFGLSLKPDEKVDIDANEVVFVHKPMDAKEEKERRKKEKAAASGNQSTLPLGQVKDQKDNKTAQRSDEVVKGSASNGAAPTKQKKEKQAKQPKAAPAPTPLSPALIDLRVGHILKAIPHPDADSLYVSTVACGDASGADNTSEYEGQVVRTVCSGLNGLVPLEEMQGRKIVAVCNLKPVTMRGIKSAAMVLAASPRLQEGEVDDHKGPVELVDPPTEAAAGDRIFFEGWEGEPEGQLNPKKKVFESLQPGFTTTQDGLVGFDVGAVEALKGDGKPLGLLKTRDGGQCKVKSLKGAIVR